MVAAGSFVVLFAWGWDPETRRLVAYSGVAWVLPLTVVLAVLLRRRTPWLAVVMVVLVEWVTRASGLAGPPFTTTVVVYALAVVRDRRQAGAAAIIASATHAATASVFGLSWPGAAVNIAGCVVAVVAGIRARQVQGRLETLTSVLEVERRQREELAAAAERDRIATLLHDVLTNSACLTSRLAEVALASIANGDVHGTRRSVEQIERTSRSALTEIRHTTTAIRHTAGTPASVTTQAADDAPVTPETLIDAARDAGLPVVSQIRGARDADPAVARAMARCLGECLSNVMKHADPQWVRVTITYPADDHGGELVVENDGVRPRSEVPHSDGLGLPSLRRIARDLGGEVRVGVVDDAVHHGTTWRTALRVPARAEVTR